MLGVVDMVLRPSRSAVAAAAVLLAATGFVALCSAGSGGGIAVDSGPLARSPDRTLCSQLIEPAGYPCAEHTVETKDGYLLALQRVSFGNREFGAEGAPPVLLQHGLFMAGDVWFLDSPVQSLGFILADHGFDVWVGNVRGTRWSHGHVSLSEKDKDFWDWSWEELALYDLAEMIRYISSITSSKVFLVGHSQGTIMSLAALTQPAIAEMVKAAALLCPISYLGHVSAPLVLRMVSMHLDQMVVAMGIHQLNFRSEIGVNLLDSVCDGHIECNDLLTSITGKNCCFNNSRVDFYLEYEPHPSSSKNLRHLFQMIRKGSFAMYDYGFFKNMKMYGQLKPPAFDLKSIPQTLPLWMAYGGNDALADEADLQLTLEELQSKPELLYIEKYGHVDFIVGLKAKEDVYDHMIEFFTSFGKSLSS
ncbi:triacylglycerol lipase 1 [Eucalyptus grandis]|uniref:triacylglycerol lipase 1 n=1 Tax=Eucalyptus grandis TaxID=71139 RepID=UPI00192EB0AE|nr:triacylglycerol lipase 1 [Eucalyptus grandis]